MPEFRRVVSFAPWEQRFGTFCEEGEDVLMEVQAVGDSLVGEDVEMRKVAQEMWVDISKRLIEMIVKGLVVYLE